MRFIFKVFRKRNFLDLFITSLIMRSYKLLRNIINTSWSIFIIYTTRTQNFIFICIQIFSIQISMREIRIIFQAKLKGRLSKLLNPLRSFIAIITPRMNKRSLIFLLLRAYFALPFYLLKVTFINPIIKKSLSTNIGLYDISTIRFNRWWEVRVIDIMTFSFKWKILITYCASSLTDL